ncbi:MAG: glycogen synthase [Bacteroidia bacterium]|nr:glycogen synthase [Bacteroidia bacterium]
MQYRAVHFSAEVYPVAKTGGLGDVAGALPKYLNDAGCSTCVIMPRYNSKWDAANNTVPVHHGYMKSEHYGVDYMIRKSMVDFGFDLYFVDLPYLLYRENLYGYSDDPERFLFFQHAALDWINTWAELPEILHCHDHHTGLIPFMVEHCYKFERMRGIKSVFTIHNALYTGACRWSMARYFPDFSYHLKGYLDWDEAINPLATGIKCSHKLTTVSRGYLDELKFGDNPMRWLFNEYWQKSYGIVNGIDNEVWDPANDSNIYYPLQKDWTEFKQKNKAALCETVNFNPDLPLMVFIGRLVKEKGGELLPQAIGQFVSQSKHMNFYILGSGVSHYEEQIKHISTIFNQNVTNYIGYNEALAHKLYAAADFLIMPSLTEPCGLNQLYAMRYATVPVVRAVGGLKDTVIDYGDADGYGIRFNNADAGDIIHSMHRAATLYHNNEQLNQIRQRISSFNYSWENAVKQYLEIYNN